MRLDSEKLLKLWSFCEKLPLGKWVFSKILGLLVPYTGSVAPRVLKLELGKAEAALKDRRSIRNHLGSVHAVALMNIGELVTGLACLSAQPPRCRSILKSLKITYHKKARGRLTAKAETPIVKEFKKSDIEVNGFVYDESGTLVSSVEAVWAVDVFK